MNAAHARPSTALVTLAATIATACGVFPLSSKSEYEEDVYVALDGSATWRESLRLR